MGSESWVALAAVLAGLLTTVANLLYTRSSQARQIKAERQRVADASELQTRREHEQRLWDARAKAYSEYLGWLQGAVREVLRDPDERLFKGEVPGGWWKTPYDLRTSMVLFESDEVRKERGTLAESLSALVHVIDIIERDPEKHPTVRDGLRREADEALQQIDVITRTIRGDMRAGVDGRSSQPDWTEELGELDVYAKAESARLTERLLQALSNRSREET
ncbi:hypothetical protein ACFWUU_31455 [Kribbella sp. NPDC058693]|uniref:hypothetical protein n=1 Tax=Kribbella sp. NPDC058693 TaxID=3346602 RepID=UPI00365FDF6F